MKKNLLLIIIFFAQISFGQIQGVVIDSLTQKPIPFTNIWVLNEPVGTSANEQGEFELAKQDKGKSLVFSAVGYKNKTIIIAQLTNKIVLKASETQLDEIVLSAKKDSDTIIGYLKKNKVQSSFTNSAIPRIWAKFIPYKDNYKKTPFIHTISIVTKSRKANSKFLVRLYLPDSTGKPSAFMIHKPIIATAQKGKHLTTIDLSAYNLEFPKSGFFVGIENLIIDANRYESVYTYEGSSKKHISILYNPSIGLFYIDTYDNDWSYINGLWQRLKFKYLIGYGPKKFQNKLLSLAVMLHLTN